MKKGSKHTLKTIAYMKKIFTGVNNPNYGKKKSDECRKRISDAAKKRYENPTEREKTRQCTLRQMANADTKLRHDIACKNNKFSKEARLNGRKITLERQHFPYKNTKIELKMQKCLTLLNIKYETNYLIKHEQFGWHSVDIMILDHNGKPKIAIECDGCYWHGCPIHYPERLRERDVLVNNGLKMMNMHVVRLWECEINNMLIDDVMLND